MAASSSEPGGLSSGPSKLQQIIADLNCELVEDPTNVLAHDKRGNAYFQLKEYQRAISDYTRALELDPQCAAAYLHRGQAFAALGYHRWAAADFSRAEALDLYKQQLVLPLHPVMHRASETKAPTRAASLSGRHVGPGSKIGIVNALLYFPMILVAECGLLVVVSAFGSTKYLIILFFLLALPFLIASIVVFIRGRHRLLQFSWKQRIRLGIACTFALWQLLEAAALAPDMISTVLFGCIVMSYGIALGAIALY